MIEAKMRSFTLAVPEQRGGPVSYKILAFSKFDFPGLNMTIAGVALTWSAERGYCAVPPNAPVKNGDGLAVRWVHDSQMGLSMVDLMVRAFESMGGVMPGPHNPKPRHNRPLQIVASTALEHDEPDNSGLHRTVGAA